jgi:hypothetical protein
MDPIIPQNISPQNSNLLQQQGRPVPPTIPSNGMWIGFLYILFFTSLYILTGAIAGVLHLWINSKVPNFTVLDNPYLSYIPIDSQTIMRGYLASILISYPICVILGFFLKKQMLKNRILVNIRSRKILIYITLIGTFLIIVWNIIGAIFGLLAGSLLINIFENLLITLLIAGSIFGYFISEVKDDSKIL